MDSEFTHLDSAGNARMVDVGQKGITPRQASAEAVVAMRPETVRRLQAGEVEKGNVLTIARIAGIAAAKHTSDWIPLCHPLRLDAVEIEMKFVDPARLAIVARVAARERTGVEMEALTAATAAALTVYDMCKSLDRGMTIEHIRVLEKSGGASGTFHHPQAKTES